MSRADTISLCTVAVHQLRSSNAHIVYVSDGVWYQFYVDNQVADLYWSKTSNSGITWTVPAVIKATTTIGGIAVWFDKWTPSDTGAIVHLAYFEIAGAHDVLYRAFNTADDTMGTEIVVLAGTSGVGGANSCISVTKSKAGRILVGYDIDGGTELGFAKSDDYPVTAFTAKTDFQEATSDYYILLPGNYADTNDIDCIYKDRSAAELSLKTYDDSANNWTGVSAETSIATGITDVSTTTAGSQFSSAVRNSDGHIILVSWTAFDTLNADLKCWDINGAASITEKTDVVLNSTDDQGLCAIGIDSTNDDLYVFYGGKSDGSETFSSAINIYYKISTDDGATWGAETLLTAFPRTLTLLCSSLEFSTAAQFVVSYFGIEISGDYTGYVSAVLPEAGGGGLLRHPGMSGGISG